MIMEQCNSAGTDLGLTLQIFITLRGAVCFFLTMAYIHLSEVSINHSLPFSISFVYWLMGISGL